MSIFQSPRSWDEFKKFNLREILEEVEAEDQGKDYSGMEKNVVFIMSALNALREGLLEIEKRMEVEPDTMTRKTHEDNRPSESLIESVISAPIDKVDEYIQAGYQVKRIYSKHAILIKLK